MSIEYGGKRYALDFIDAKLSGKFRLGSFYGDFLLENDELRIFIRGWVRSAGWIIRNREFLFAIAQLASSITRRKVTVKLRGIPLSISVTPGSRRG